MPAAGHWQTNVSRPGGGSGQIQMLGLQLAPPPLPPPVLSTGAEHRLGRLGRFVGIIRSDPMHSRRAAITIHNRPLGGVCDLLAVGDFDAEPEHLVGDRMPAGASAAMQSAAPEEQRVELVGLIATDRRELQLKARWICAHAAHADL